MNSFVFLVVVAASCSLVSSQSLGEVCEEPFGQFLGIYQMIEESKLDCMKELEKEFLGRDFENLDANEILEATADFFTLCNTEEADKCILEQRAIYKEVGDDVADILMNLEVSEECDNKLTEVVNNFIEDIAKAVEKVFDQC